MSNFIDYNAYINSEAWQLKRSEFLSSGKPRSKYCYVCQIPQQPGFHVHHMTYDNLGCERFADLAVVCPSCHELVHAVHNKAMAKYLEGRRRTLPTLKSSTRQVRLDAEVVRAKAKRLVAVATPHESE